MTGFALSPETVNQPSLKAQKLGISQMWLPVQGLLLSNPGKTSRVPVRLCNRSAKMVTLPPRGNICELHEVKLLRSLPLNNTEGVTAHANHQKAEKERFKHLETVDLDDTKLSSVQKNKVVQFLYTRQHVFRSLAYRSCPTWDTFIEWATF